MPAARAFGAEKSRHKTLQSCQTHERIFHSEIDCCVRICITLLGSVDVCDVCAFDLMDEDRVLFVPPRYRPRSLVLSVYEEICPISRNRFVVTMIFELRAFKIAFVLQKN